ncbi:hypothetical protein CCAX7_17760 [Capsulimonas corticalis]|uniref:Uncharacterized protein n=1 Tax=Capsulimonas corticalis TaxID=2219043 RepID=A0A402D3V1_9BACT|nr:alkaline phosphatase family protein [Capsulimonas corticalis]BDI29725.1 hypothetical protein CCAX7_17760 [Capsulimonas corticalis]
MKRAPLAAFLFASIAICAPGANAAHPHVQYQVTNFTLSGGDPTFSVASDVTFQNLDLTETFADSTTQTLSLYDLTSYSKTNTLDTGVLSVYTNPFSYADMGHGAITSATLNGSFDLTNLDIEKSFGGPLSSANVFPSFTASFTPGSFNSFFDVFTNIYAVDAQTGEKYGVGTFGLTATPVPEPSGLVAMLAASGLALLGFLFRRTRKGAVVAIAVVAAAGVPQPPVKAATIDAGNWASVTAPVYGSSQSGVYSGAELFTGPNQFGSYFSGVLPNGRIVRPAGVSAQIGMNPLGTALTPDGKYLITTNDDERDGSGASSFSLQSSINRGGYSISVIDTATLSVVSQINTAGKLFVGLQATGSGTYTIWASSGGDNSIKLFTVSSAGAIAGPVGSIAIAPITPQSAGYVSNYTPIGAAATTTSAPTGYSKSGAKITFPAGSALSPDGKFLYVACNGDNSVAIIDTASKTVVKQVPVGYFPYAVAVSKEGNKILVSNWGATEYKFKNPAYDGAGNLTSIAPVPGNAPDGYYVPVTSTTGSNPKTSSISILAAPGANGASASLLGSIYEGAPLDQLYQVGDTHPSALASVRRGTVEVLYVAKANDDSLGLIQVSNNRKLPDFDLSPIGVTLLDGHKIHGSYPNALAVSPDNTRLYVAEAGLNSVAVLDTTVPTAPKLIGRIPTGWYPTGLSVSPDGKTLYIVNAKGVGEDINPNTVNAGHNPTGIESFTDGNYIFGTVQKVDLTATHPNKTQVPSYNYAINPPADTSVVPAGGAASNKIKHVFFILHENKTFDSMLGNQNGHFGPYASLTYNNPDGSPFVNGQYTGVSLNTQQLATTFATAVNYYSDSEESDAGHQFSASGTATDYTEKTLLVKSGRGLLVNKNFEPEDYPEGGYIFNNAARNGVSFKDYGALIRIVGTDTGTSVPTTIDDPASGLAGYPQLQADAFHITSPLVNAGDTESTTQGLGQAYFMALPILSVLGTSNPSGEARLDKNYPGYNFNISDQRRAKEFIKDFDRQLANGTLPQFIYLYQPNDHTGGVQAPNAGAVGTSPLQQVGDGDTGLGMVVNHIMKSPAYYDPSTDTGSAIFITYDDAQSSLDHIQQHRTPLVVVSPFAKPGYLAKKHYVTASVVKTEELLLGLPPNNLGDLFATDLRDLFQPTYNGITASSVPVTRTAQYTPSPEGRKIWSLVAKLDSSAPDRDSHRLGALARMSVKADEVHSAAVKKNHLHSAAYKALQARLYQTALTLVNGPAPKDSDD